MRSIFCSVFLFTILYINSTLSMALPKTMKLVMCYCTDNMHERPVAEFGEQDLIAIESSTSRAFRAVAVPQILHDSFLDKSKTPHLFLKDGNNSSRHAVAFQHVLIFDTTGTPDTDEDGELTLYFSSNSKTEIKGSMFYGTTLSSSKEARVAIVRVDRIKSSGITWNSESKVTASDLTYAYKAIYNGENIPQLKTTTEIGTKLPAITLEQATFVLFVLEDVSEETLEAQEV